MKFKDPKSGKVYDTINSAVNQFCKEFLARAVYGECKAFCPLHGANYADSVHRCTPRSLGSADAEEIAAKIGFEVIPDA